MRIQCRNCEQWNVIAGFWDQSNKQASGKGSNRQYMCVHCETVLPMPTGDTPKPDVVENE